jgi:tartrate/fumarate subfamily iron-sulfur-dependent hydro-lyase beta chain
MIVTSPADERTVRKLKVGQNVYVTGTVVTGRDRVHMRALSSKEVPEVLYGSTLFHCGPIMVFENEKWNTVAAGPTTSARMNKSAAEIIRKFNIRIIIGKGGMSPEVLGAMKENGCVYLAAIGGAAVSLAECITSAMPQWEDLGMAEAMWVFRTERFGPLVVAMDADGKSIYDDVNEKVDATLKKYQF